MLMVFGFGILIGVIFTTAFIALASESDEEIEESLRNWEKKSGYKLPEESESQND